MKSCLRKAGNFVTTCRLELCCMPLRPGLQLGTHGFKQPFLDQSNVSINTPQMVSLQKCAECKWESKCDIALARRRDISFTIVAMIFLSRLGIAHLIIFWFSNHGKALKAENVCKAHIYMRLQRNHLAHIYWIALSANMWQRLEWSSKFPQNRAEGCNLKENEIYQSNCITPWWH